MSAADPVADLRKRLAAMRADLVAAMARDGYSAGLGATLASINAALAALDEAPQSLAERGSGDGEPPRAPCGSERFRQ